MSERNAVICENVTFKYFEQVKKPILDGVNLSIEAGKITVIMGKSGCGKSTLAAVIAGLYPENGGVLKAGKVYLNGKLSLSANRDDKVELTSPTRRSLELSQMFQNADLQFCMNTLREELKFCMENISVPPQQMDERIEWTAKEMGMEDLLDRKLFSLSGGEKQKAMLCCQFIIHSRILLLDEPFANIDWKYSKKIVNTLHRMNQKYHTTIIAVDHSLEYWKDVADEIKILGEGGKVLRENITLKNLSQYRDLFSKEGLHYPFDKPHSREYCKNSETVVALNGVRIFAGKKKKIGKKASGAIVLENIDAQFKSGCMTALLGTSGSGKTTLFRTLLGQQNYQGSITVYGKEVSKIKEKNLLQQLGIVFQNPSNQFVTRRVQDEVLVSLKGKKDALTREESNLESQAVSLLEKYGLKKYRKYSPYMLSQGQQRRLAVLAVLAGGQKILLLDEPTYGQDAASTKAIMQQLKGRMEKENLTVIFSTHDSHLVQEWADAAYVVRNKKLEFVRMEDYNDRKIECIL